MLISHSKKFIFTKTVKTASTSIEVYFERFCSDIDGLTECHGGKHFLPEFRDENESSFGIVGFRGLEKDRLIKKPMWFHHMSALQIKNQIGSQIWNEYTKFFVIRNPYDKVLSIFFHFYIYRNNIKINNIDSIDLFRKWVKKGQGIIIDRDKYVINGVIITDTFIRYENLKPDLEKICKILDIPFDLSQLPSYKSGFRPINSSLSDFYDYESINIINELFSFEFEHFNYDHLT
jgi:hypothetical protein